MRVYIEDLEKYVGKKVKLKGWVNNFRELSSFYFLVLRDTTGTEQCVLDKNILLNKDINYEDVISIEGEVVKEDRAKKGYEVRITKYEVISKNKLNMPFNVWQDFKKMNLKLSTILDHRSLSFRNNKINSIFRLFGKLVQYYREYMISNNFIEIFTPKIVSMGTESGAEVFKVDYFGKTAYLAQSPQFYKQHLAGVYEKVFETGHVYRAEKHNTARHINEYYSLDVEMAFVEIKDLINSLTGVIKYIFQQFLNNDKHLIDKFNCKLFTDIDEIFSIKYKDAIEVARKKIKDVSTLDSRVEKIVTNIALEKTGIPLAYIVEYPLEERPFYTMPKGKYSQSFDLIFNGMEITTGSIRIHDYDMLVERIKESGLDINSFDTYLEPFKAGMPPHGGFAIGSERLLLNILKLDNVRETTFYPRDIERLEP